MPNHKARKTRRTSARKPQARKPQSHDTKVAFLPISVKTGSAEGGATAAAEIPVAVKTSPHSSQEPVLRTAEIPVALKRGRKAGAPLALRTGHGASTKVTAIPLALDARHSSRKRVKKAAPHGAEQTRGPEVRRDPAKVWNEAVKTLTDLELFAVDAIFDVVKAILWVIAGRPSEAPQRAKVLAIDTLRTVEESALAA